MHDPSQCKLNNPHNYWSPTLSNENSRDVWITFDLGMKRIMDKIHIQGSQNHKQYVQSIWIDYSDDGCQWKSHPMRAIRCKYYSNPSVKQLHWLNNIPLNKVNSNEEDDSLYSTQSINSLYPKHDHETETASIKIWPVINAQFIRIRPYEWHNRISMRIELFGPKTPRAEFGRIVTLDTVNERDKNSLINILKDKPANTKAIQVDCKAVITAALDRAGCISYGFVTLKSHKSHEYKCHIIMVYYQ